MGARTKVDLEAAEGDVSLARLVRLMERPPVVRGDLEDLRAIHLDLLQDVYDWAGHVHTVDIRRKIEGAQFFLPVALIDRTSVFAADELRQDRMLRWSAAQRSQ